MNCNILLIILLVSDFIMLVWNLGIESRLVLSYLKKSQKEPIRQPRAKHGLSATRHLDTLNAK